MNFQISALNVDQFTALFGLDEQSLARHGAQRIAVDSTPGYPCRVSLQDAEIGENVLLLNYEHQSAPSPYRSSHAIFVREGCSQATPGINEIPEMFRHRLLSLRTFDAAGMMVNADIVEGARLEKAIEHMLDSASVDYLHVHNAKPGCYMATVRRA